MEGYPQLAVLQGKYPQLGIYRRFVTLNARNLLYLQAEIMDLEKRLDEYTLEDIQSDDEDRKTFSRNVFFLSSGQGAGQVANSQWHTMMLIRQKLREYNEILIQQRQILTFDKPGEGNLEFLNHWLADSEHGNNTLEGIDQNVWKEEKDLLVVLPNTLDDSFTRWFRKPVVDYYHSWFGKNFVKPTDIENGLHEYQEKTIIRAADLIGTIISATIPIVAVVTLYSINNMFTRLGMVALFTTGFSLILVVVTKAKRIEIFAATAAFASVQVVFVGSIASDKHGTC